MRRTALAVVVSSFVLVQHPPHSIAGELVTVRVHGDEKLERGWLREAPVIAERVFAAAGMRLAWVHCLGSATDAVCGRPALSNEFIVRIGVRPDDPARTTDSQSLRCGESHRPDGPPGHYVTVYHDCISAMSGRLEVAEAVLAVHVIAHEIGHLLLPVGHAAAGIMRERFDRSDMELAVKGRLGFTRTEQRQLLAALRQRLAPVREAAGR
jgi:hypothetical protein